MWICCRFDSHPWVGSKNWTFENVPGSIPDCGATPKTKNSPASRASAHLYCLLTTNSLLFLWLSKGTRSAPKRLIFIQNYDAYIETVGFLRRKM